MVRKLPSQVDWYMDGKFVAKVTPQEASKLARDFRSPNGAARKVSINPKTFRLDVF